MSTLTAPQVAAYARAAGFSNTPGTYGGLGLTWAVAVALAESGGDPAAVGGPNRDGSHDYGLWQINDKAHPGDAAKALDPAACAAAAYRISSAGRSFTPWSTMGNGTAAAQLGRASLAVAASPASTPTTTQAGFDVPGTNIPGIDLPGWTDPLHLLGSAGGAISSTGDALASVAKAAVAFVGFEARAVEWVGNPHNMLRILQVAGGSVLLIMGVRALADSGAGPVAAAAGGAIRAAKAPARAAKVTSKAAVSAGAALATDGASLAAQGAGKAAKATKG